MEKIKIVNDTKRGEIVIYKTAENEVDLKVRLEKETVWLNLNQISFLFNTDKSGISRHIENIYQGGELSKKPTVAKIATVQNEGGRSITRSIDYYNLDVILSVGYRVNSKQATRFRIWATSVLKKYLTKGYAINEKHLMETREKFKELQSAINFLEEKSKKELLIGQEGELLNLLATYAKTLTILDEYDKEKIKEIKGAKSIFILTYENCLKIISELKKELTRKKEAGDLFGQEREGSFGRIIESLYQTFGGKELYPNIEDKASHILYLIIKDHPFSDGNKRSGAFLFVYFLDKSDYHYRQNGEKKISDNALTALTLLVAESDPKEKDVMIKIIKNLIAE